MIDALFLIGIGAFTVLWGAKGFFGGLLVFSELAILRFYLPRRAFLVKRILPGKSLKIVVFTEGTKVKVLVPLVLLQVLKPFLETGGAISQMVSRFSSKDERIDVTSFLMMASQFIDVLQTIEGEIISVETPHERVEIHIE